MARIRMGHAVSAENGTKYGKPGDSTGREVRVQDWYDRKSWGFMAIHPDASIREKHAKAVEAACANNCIGYSQGAERNSLYPLAKEANFDISKIKTPCNTDCSALQNVCAVAAGTPGISYGANGWSTHTMEAKLKAAGYAIIRDSKYLKSAEYCVRGAIYCTAGKHTACGLDNGARASETLRAAGLTADKPVKAPEAASWTVDRLLKKKTPMMRGDDVKGLQERLKDAGFNPGEIDGIFGERTRAAVWNYQQTMKLEVDGIVGKQTTKKLGGNWTG